MSRILNWDADILWLWLIGSFFAWFILGAFGYYTNTWQDFWLPVAVAGVFLALFTLGRKIRRRIRRQSQDGGGRP